MFTLTFGRKEDVKRIYEIQENCCMMIKIQALRNDKLLQSEKC